MPVYDNLFVRKDGGRSRFAAKAIRGVADWASRPRFNCGWTCAQRYPTRSAESNWVACRRSGTRRAGRRLWVAALIPVPRGGRNGAVRQACDGGEGALHGTDIRRGRGWGPVLATTVPLVPMLACVFASRRPSPGSKN